MNPVDFKENTFDTSKNHIPSTGRAPLQCIPNCTVLVARKVPVPRHLEEDSQEIIQNLLDEQNKVPSFSDYMSSQPDITHKMRSIALDWLVSVHRRFRLLTETLFMTVSVLDRFLSVKPIVRQELQLVCVAAFFLAAKYEEIYPPELNEIVYLTDKAYTPKQVLRMERDILSTLNFELTVPTTWRLFEGLSDELSVQGSSMGQYLLELSLIEYHMLKYPQAMQAASALFLGEKIFKRDTCMSSYGLGFTYLEIKACAKDMLILLQAAPKHPLSAVREKFAKQDNHEVSKLRLS